MSTLTSLLALIVVLGRDLRTAGGYSLPSTSSSSLHRCTDLGEAYSASWLATAEHVREQFVSYNLSLVNCEMASFIMVTGDGVSSSMLTDCSADELVHLSSSRHQRVGVHDPRRA